MARTRWSGPLQTGVDTGATSTSTLGNALITQIATVAGNASGITNITIPANSDIMSIRMVVTSAASAATSIAAQGTNFRIGRVAGNDAYFGTIKVSALRPYEMGIDAMNLSNASTAAWKSVSADTPVFVDATAVTSASALAQLGARLYITYFQR